MAGKGRLERARERLRAARRQGPAETTDEETDQGTKPAATAGAAAPATGEDAAEIDADSDGSDGHAEREVADSPAGLAPLSLGDINENRRESVARRLGALRERGPRARDGSGAQDEAGPEPDDAGAKPRRFRLDVRRLSAGASSATGSAAAGARRIGQGSAAAVRNLRKGSAGAGRRIGETWRGVPVVTRVRLAAAAIVAAIVAFVLVVVVPAAPCGAPGGEECPPPDDAIALVPDDALAYAHVDIDIDGEQFQAASELVARLPLLSRLALGQLAGIAGRPVDFDSQVRPWAGDEIAVAVLPGLGQLEQVVMVEVADAEGATSFAAELIGPGSATEDVGGIEVASVPGGGASAILDGFLLLGDAGAVGELIDPSGEQGSLETAAATTVLEELPEERLAYGYLSGEGARAVLDVEGPLGPLDTFVDADASVGVGVALTAGDGLLELEVRSELDPERVQASPPFFASLPAFDPTLPADVGSDALAYLGIGDPQASIESLINQAAADAPALLSAFNRVEEDLRREGGISLTGELLPLLGSEAAISVEPVSAEGVDPPPGTLAPSGVPYVSLIADGVDSAAAARSLAALQAPLVAALAPAGSGKVGAFEAARIAGVDAQSLLVNPDVNLTYATFDDRLVVATNPVGIAQARAEGDGLEATAGFAEVTQDLPDEVSLLAYLDLRGLIALGEQIGLGADPTYATFAADLRALDAAALAVTDFGDELRTDLRIAIGEAEAAQTESSPLAGG